MVCRRVWFPRSRANAFQRKLIAGVAQLVEHFLAKEDVTSSSLVTRSTQEKMVLSKTLQNLESALAGESMAHIKYRYFAQIARDEGYHDIADHFEHTADQEIKHAWGHLELLVGYPSTKQCLEMAIKGETYEYTEMYPKFEDEAIEEGDSNAALEARMQANESKMHAAAFIELLDKAERRFAALAKVEERHANAYRQKLGELDE